MRWRDQIKIGKTQHCLLYNSANFTWAVRFLISAQRYCSATTAQHCSTVTNVCTRQHSLLINNNSTHCGTRSVLNELFIDFSNQTFCGVVVVAVVEIVVVITRSNTHRRKKVKKKSQHTHTATSFQLYTQKRVNRTICFSTGIKYTFSNCFVMVDYIGLQILGQMFPSIMRTVITAMPIKHSIQTIG